MPMAKEMGRSKKKGFAGRALAPPDKINSPKKKLT
jgi:hypothetical protein